MPWRRSEGINKTEEVVVTSSGWAGEKQGIRLRLRMGLRVNGSNDG